MSRLAYEACMTCEAYALRRRNVLLPEFVKRKRRTGETAQQVLDAYMTGVHDRHLSGLSLRTPPEPHGGTQ